MDITNSVASSSSSSTSIKNVGSTLDSLTTTITYAADKGYTFPSDPVETQKIANTLYQSTTNELRTLGALSHVDSIVQIKKIIVMVNLFRLREVIEQLHRQHLTAANILDYITNNAGKCPNPCVCKF